MPRSLSELQRRALRLLARPEVRLLVALREFILFLILTVPPILSVVRGPGLSASYRLTQLTSPYQSSQAVKTVTGSTEVDEHLQQLELFVTRSEQLLTIELSNNLNSTISDLQLLIFGAESVTDSALVSTSPILVTNMADLMTYRLDETRSTLTFPNLVSLPARAQATIFVWGTFAPMLPFLDPIQITSSDGTANVREDELLAGSRLFVAKHLAPITLIVGVLLMLVGLRRIAETRKQ